MIKKLKYNKNINGEIYVAGDKSITHRAIMLGAISNGITTIKNGLKGEDCLNTIRCFEALGIQIEEKKDTIIVYGKGLYGLKKPEKTLYVGNSGTTIRLISGILSAQRFDTKITGDNSIINRPMGRIVEPLSKMGAKICAEKGFAPLTIFGKKLNSVHYEMPVASAQVKSAILFASLYAKGDTTVVEKEKSRNHSEIMINYFGGNLKIFGNVIISRPVKKLCAKNIEVCGDISSACFFIAGAVITKNSHIIIKNVGINPTRMGFVDVLLKMGADINFENVRYMNGEKVCDISAKSSSLTACDIGGDIIPKMIDEIPLFMLVSSFAKGRSVVKDAKELKFKESDRIKTVSTELNKMGCNISSTDDGAVINGGRKLFGATCESYNDHRVAMCIAIASLKCSENIILKDYECVDTSFPNFFEILEKI